MTWKIDENIVFDIKTNKYFSETLTNDALGPYSIKGQPFDH